MLTELAVLPEQALVPVPEHLSYAEAATLPCAAVTAWNALTGDGPGTQPGHTLLTTGSGRRIHCSRYNWASFWARK